MSDHIREAQAAPSGPVFDFGDIMRRGQADIDKTVQERLAKGDFVAPEGVASADARAVTLIGRQLPGNYLGNLDPGILLLSPGMEGYSKQANAASASIDAQEAMTARRMWSNLPTDERRLIESDYKVRNISLNDGPVPTPHLDAFKKALQQQIAPLEQQRDAQVQKVWKELPTESKVLILRDQEERKRLGRQWT